MSKSSKKDKIKVFAGRYAYVKPLGRGAGGSVYLAEDLQADRRQVALKVLTPEAYGTVQGKMIRREFEILSKLDHPNLVRVYDYGRLPDGGVFLAEEYIDGFSLQDARALMEPAALIDLTLQMLDGLSYLHGMGMIHRDIKPANVMLLWLDDASAKPMVKLVDFGLSSMDPKRDTLRGGTRSYMAPEIIRGQKGEPQSDMFSLGVTLYYALCGVLPFGPRTKNDPPPTEEGFRPPEPHRLNPEVPLELSKFTMALLRQVPDVEYLDAGDASLALARDARASQLIDPAPSSMANSMDTAAPQVLRGYFQRGILTQQAQDAEYLIQALTEDGGGRGAFFMIKGSAGTGKSRLMREVETACKLSGRVVIAVRGEEGGAPWSLLTAILRRAMALTRHRSGKPMEAYRQPLCVLELLISLGMTQDEVLADAQARWIHAAFEEIASVLADEQLVLFIEDLHDADEISLDFLRSWYARPAAQRAVDLVATARPSQRLRLLEQIDSLISIASSGLRVDDVQYLLHDRLGLDEIPTSWMEQLAGLASGSPSYFEEVCRSLVDQGVMRRVGSKEWRIDLVELDLFVMPSSASESFRRRLGQIGATGRELLELMTLLGRRVSWAELRAFAEEGGEPPDAIDRAIETLIWRHVVTMDLEMSGRYLKFIDPEVARVVNAMLSPEWARGLRRRIGKVLGQRWHSGGGRAGEVVSHLVAGGRVSQATPFALAAAHDAARRGDHVEALGQYSAISEASDDGPDAALAQLGEAVSAAARFDRARCEAAMTRAASEAERTGRDWLIFRVYVDSAAKSLSLGDPAGALGWLERCADALPGMQQQPHVFICKAELALVRGDIDEAVRLFGLGLQRFSHFGNVVGRIRASAGLARAAGLRGDTEEAGAQLQRCYELAKLYDLKHHLAEALLVHARLMRLGQEEAKAIKLLTDALEALENEDRVDLWVELCLELAEARLQLGELEGAERCAVEALMLARQLDHYAFEAAATVLISDVTLHRSPGDSAACLEGMEGAMEALTRGPYYVHLQAEMARRVGQAYADSGDRERAHHYVDLSANLGEKMGAEHMYPR